MDEASADRGRPRPAGRGDSRTGRAEGQGRPRPPAVLPDTPSRSGHLLSGDGSLTEVPVVAHPPDGPERHERQQPRAHEGADAGEEEEQTHDGALHGLGRSRVGELQTCGATGCAEGRRPAPVLTAQRGRTAASAGAQELQSLKRAQRPALLGRQYLGEFKNQRYEWEAFPPGTMTGPTRREDRLSSLLSNLKVTLDTSACRISWSLWKERLRSKIFLLCQLMGV